MKKKIENYSLCCFKILKTLDKLTVPSAKAEITFPRADKDLLMFIASTRTVPSAPVFPTCANTFSLK